MKKLIAIIVVLIIIFIGMIVYRNLMVKNSINNSVNMQEIEEIETYITKIYMWKEITNEALPVFENLNQADDVWVWAVVEKNLEDYELSYEQLQNKAKELFGQGFDKEFPKDGTRIFKV